jgi:GntR family transcriptional repressor for pyruvate dehydrogenase complex
MELTAIQGKKTYKQIIEQIISLIVSGELSVGDKLPGERVLSEQLAASRSSIREAFRTLEILGILEVRHGGGTFVRAFDIAPFLNTIAPLFLQNVDIMGDMMDFRIMLECQAVRAAAQSANQNTIENMLGAIDGMSSADAHTAEQADIDFHMSIFSATGNSVFVLAGQALSYIVHTSIHTTREQSLADKAVAKQWVADHKAIFEAVKAHKSERAVKAMQSHLTGVRKYILQKTKSEG